MMIFENSEEKLPNDFLLLAITLSLIAAGCLDLIFAHCCKTLQSPFFCSVSAFIVAKLSFDALYAWSTEPHAL